MELTDEQKATVKQWVKEGLGLSDIQKKIREEFDVSMTYMDVRFLVIDLDVAVKDKEPPKDLNIDAAAGDGGAPGGGSEPEGGGIPGNVSVDVDRVTTAGMVVSGTVTFSDGVSATWGLDQMGRLALDSAPEGYRPSADDIQAFQEELRKALQNRGF